MFSIKSLLAPLTSRLSKRPETTQAQSIILPDYKQATLPLTTGPDELITTNNRVPVLDIPKRNTIKDLASQAGFQLRKKLRILQLQVQTTIRPGVALTANQHIQKLKAGPGVLIGETRLNVPAFHRFPAVTARQALMPGIHISQPVEPSPLEIISDEYSHLPELVGARYREHDQELPPNPTEAQQIQHIHNYPWPDIDLEISQRDPTTLLEPADLITDYGNTDLYPELVYDLSSAAEELPPITPVVPELPASTTLLQETVQSISEWSSNMWRSKSTLALGALAALGIYATTALPNNKAQLQTFAKPALTQVVSQAAYESTSVPRVSLSIPTVKTRSTLPILTAKKVEAKKAAVTETSKWQSLPASTSGLTYGSEGLLQLSKSLLEQASAHNNKLYFRITDQSGSQLYIPVTQSGSMGAEFGSQLNKAVTAELVSRSGGVTTIYSSSKL